MKSDTFRLGEVFSYESLVHAVSGAMGSVTAMTVFYPLDTARLRLQVDEKRKSRSTPAILAEIVKEEGLLAPYRGWILVIYSLCCSNFVYFYCFHSLKASWRRGQQSSPSSDLVIGIVAGVVNVLITTPLWVVNTRLKLQGSRFRSADIRPTNYSGILDAFVQIIRDEGVGALWNGTFPSLLLVLNPAVQFMIYEGLKRHLSSELHQELTSLEVFVIGAIAKTIATIVTYPLQTIQSILRFGQYNESLGKSKLMSSVRTVKCLLVNRVKKYGMLGLFKGLEAKLLQTVLTAALMFLFYEKIASTTFKVMGLSNKYQRKR
ncbi:peroxisomal membrane protein PMP34 isoform X1 [Thalassophryne amazonica]|uniref:peroxisomal membrane protein PMP34 isoform X1 n=1 Tax=Thalassophryne amazonica TaxID=390379 RepID=UPI0014714830|nr:peroxisomal membrane protein PMP34 isoform X1 [Thalassophryne amazonica]